MFSGKKELLGVDIGTSSIKVVALSESKGVFHLEGLGSVPLPPEAIVDNSIMDAVAITDALTGVLESLKLKHKGAATSVAGHSVIIRKIQLPLMAEEELESQLQFEAEQYIPFDVADVYIDFQILGPDAKDPSQMNVILVAAKRDFIEDYQALFGDAGLQLRVLDIDCFAVENMMEVNYGFLEDEIVALVDVGASSVSVNILKGGESVFTRDIQAGGNYINEELQKRLGLSSDVAELLKLGQESDEVEMETAEAILKESAMSLAQDVQRSLDFFTATAGDDKIQKVYLVGGASKMPQLKAGMEERMGVPVEVADPFRGLAVNEKNFDPEYLEVVGPDFGVAVGLATRRVGDK